MILEAAEMVENEAMAKDIEGNEVPERYQHISPDDDAFSHEDEEREDKEAEKEADRDEIEAHTHPMP